MEGTRIILVGLGWHLSQLRSVGIALCVMVLFLNATKTWYSLSSRSEASDLLQSIDRQIEACVSDCGVIISALSSRIVLVSVRGLLGSLSAVVAFGHAMERHGIIVIATSA